MTISISLTESDVFTALRMVLLQWVPESVEVVKSMTNRVPEPEGSDFIVMTPVTRTRLSTNIIAFNDGFHQGLSSTRTDTEKTNFSIQLDVHGPESGDNAQMISTLFRSDVACSAFSDSGFDVQPLYADEPRQLAFSNGQQQIENRWTFDVYLQANIDVTSNQQFMDEIDPLLINVNIIP